MPPAGGEDSAQEKTLDPTQRKLDEAQDRGEFARSREITTVAVFFVALCFLALGREYMTGRILRTGAFFLSFDRFIDLSVGTTPEFFFLVLRHTLPLVLPILLLVFFAAIGAETAQIGIRFVKDPFEPKWNRLNPAVGFKRMFSLRQFVEGLKSIIKISIFVYVSYLTIAGAMPEILKLPLNTPAQGAHLMLSIGLRLGFRSCLVLVFFAGFDYWFQRWSYRKGLRMTHQELKDEIKEREGDPVLKARIRSIQMEIARKRMMTAVPDSDVVVVNPTRYAVALSYDPEKNSAPVVVAKGQNFIAARIREIALREGVPVVENAPLARALYRKAPVGSTIPAELFKAVAQILASIWKLAQRRGRAWTGDNVRRAA
ncbi:flagellar biosynthesis protein FlhB [Candidatus Sumerlaeota bacterium]|nr:flagellar biosynthesis protein FlhB [Candidatus Sumerlaeota bacterium]